MSEYEVQELFQLSDGRYIADKELSDKLYHIKNVHPETAYQDGKTPYEWNENGMSELFSECYRNDTRYCPEKKTWYTYHEGRWVKDIESLWVAGKIQEFVRLMALYCGEIVEEDKRKEYLKFVARMGDRRFRDRIMRDAQNKMTINAEQFDTHPYLINCRNGTYDLKTLTFREHTWSDFLTMQTNFNYTLQDVSCPRWLQFIDEVTQGDKDKADYLQRALGYSILGTSKEECMFILHGRTTRNGKSTLLDAIQHMLGDYSDVAPVAMICKSGRSADANAPNPVLAKLKGVRFVTMAESESSGKLDEAAIKQYTGGEAITARALYEKSITFIPQFTLWLSCNDLPAITDRTLFASERIRVIEFNRHFSEEEQDKSLKDFFRTDEAMKGIFAWLVAGYFKYLRFGLVMSDDMRAVVKQYEKDNDLVLQFLEEKCEINPESTTRLKVLFDTYKLWCKSNGYHPFAIKRFGAELLTHVKWYKSKTKENGQIVFYGLRMKGGV